MRPPAALDSTSLPGRISWLVTGAESSSGMALGGQKRGEMEMREGKPDHDHAGTGVAASAPANRPRSDSKERQEATKREEAITRIEKGRDETRAFPMSRDKKGSPFGCLSEFSHSGLAGYNVSSQGFFSACTRNETKNADQVARLRDATMQKTAPPVYSVPWCFPHKASSFTHTARHLGGGVPS